MLNSIFDELKVVKYFKEIKGSMSLNEVKFFKETKGLKRLKEANFFKRK